MRVEVKTPLREVRFRVSACLACVMLSIDSLNPIKVITSIIGLNPNWVGGISLFVFCGILYVNASELMYFMTKVFFHSILMTFFSSMEVLGKENIPIHGPIIFTGNHMNQFVDGTVLLVTSPHNVGFLVAEKSYHKRVIGDFMKAIGCIPVSRPQDSARKGSGKVRFEGLKLLGDGTKFTSIQRGEKLRPGRSSESYKIQEVISDTEAILGEVSGEASPELEEHAQGKWADYELLAYVDQGKMFEAVQAALAKGRCLGIFPEGGSHDQTDLLPLKAGVAVIALSTFEKYGVTVPIVPVGLNYFRGHRFRGRVVVEFGEPITITKEIYQTYKESKRIGYQTLLSQVEEGMRSVIVTAPDYADLKLIHTTRRLYQRAGLTTKKKQDLARRFSAAHRLLRETYGEGKVPEDMRTLQTKLEEYQEILDTWGLKDYQIADLETSYSKLMYSFVHGLIVIVLASIPSLILNAPVGFAAKYWSFKEAQKDLKASRVKVAARDVMLSKKMLFSIVAVPTLWVTYALLLYFFSSLETRAIVVLFLSCPLFAYMGVMGVEASMIDIKDLRPAFLRLMPSFRSQAQSLPGLRADLQKEVRVMVKKYGPQLGAVYFDKGNAWEHQIQRSLSNTNFDGGDLTTSSSGGADADHSKKEN